MSGKPVIFTPQYVATELGVDMGGSNGRICPSQEETYFHVFQHRHKITVFKQLMQFSENWPTRCCLHLCTDLPADVGFDLYPSVRGPVAVNQNHWMNVCSRQYRLVIVEFQQLRRRVMAE